MDIKLYDSELRIMQVLWEEGDSTAKRIAERMKEEVGWGKTTTYTVLKKCIDKGAIERFEPNFVCHALVTQAQAQEYETAELLDKMYGGRADRLVASLLGSKRLTGQEVEELKKLVEDLE